ncbi:type IX secretion system membrane protein PorP/SprF [bacterium]|nr:type IX secretion system membrane protein PorP/SprF [bacterium]
MKKLVFTILCGTLSLIGLQAQQLAQVSQYFSTGLLYNPAVAGSREGIPIYSLIRRQWVHIEEAPVTQTIAGHGHVGQNMGLGGVLFNDATGPSRLTGFSFSTARHFNLSPTQKGTRSQEDNSVRLSLGLSAQLFQYQIDLDKVTFDIENDPVKDKVQDGLLTPDMSFGALLYTKDYFIGLSAPNLFQTKLDLYDIAELNENQLKRQYLIMGQYKKMLDDNSGIIPSFLGKYLPGAPLQFDATIRYQYSFEKQGRQRREKEARDKNIWAGVSYRTGDAVVLMVGLNQEFFNIGYSYDITTSNVRRYSSGTHELFIGMLLNNPLDKD